MSDHCRICHQDFTDPSFGGPGICPACDCGIPPDVTRLQRTVAALTAENAQLRETLTLGLGEQESVIEGLRAENKRLRRTTERHHSAFAVIDTAISEAHAAWDADNDSRCGKLLAALSGVLRGYRPMIDEAREAFNGATIAIIATYEGAALPSSRETTDG